MACIASISAKMPIARIKVALALCVILRPFAWSEAMQERIGAAMMEWIQRGVRVYADGKQV